MKASLTIILILALLGQAFAQQITSPLEKNNYQKVTSFDELTHFAANLKKMIAVQ